eukprot:evm.model.scf_977.1 EVM.evm.TU.scf_977.1   scf_977:4509-9602(+)
MGQSNAPSEGVRLPYWYEVQGELGHGGQGLVLLARDTRLPQGSAPVAIKCIPRWALTRERSRKCAEREILNHRKLFHKHVVAFREAFLTQTHLCIVLDYATGGDMRRLLLERHGGAVGEVDARWYFQMLITAVDYCHKRGVTNRDIKLDNLLVEHADNQCPPIVMICDFGLSKHKESITPPTSNVGTPSYKAPEVILSSGKDYDPAKADIYSCGVVLYRLLMGIDKFPLGNPRQERELPRQEYLRNLQSLIDSQGDDAIRLPEQAPKGPLSPECRDLLRSMLAVNPGRRISMDGIWAHPWFKVELPEGTRGYNDKMCDPAVLGKHFSRIQSEEELRDMVTASGQCN